MLFPISLFFNIPMVYTIDYDLKFGLQLVCFIIFVWILFKKTSRNILIFQILVFILSFTIYINDYDRSLFFGEKIGEAYTADVPGGYEYLELYEGNKCSLNMGFISSDTYYGKYEIHTDTIICFIKGGLWDLANSKIEIEGKSYILKNPK